MSQYLLIFLNKYLVKCEAGIGYFLCVYANIVSMINTVKTGWFSTNFLVNRRNSTPIRILPNHDVIKLF